MPSEKDQSRSSYGAFTARERELERSRARRDVIDARDAVRDAGDTEGRPALAADRPSP
jgi:hypothetical protein